MGMVTTARPSAAWLGAPGCSEQLRCPPAGTDRDLRIPRQLPFTWRAGGSGASVESLPSVLMGSMGARLAIG